MSGIISRGGYPERKDMTTSVNLCILFDNPVAGMRGNKEIRKKSFFFS